MAGDQEKLLIDEQETVQIKDLNKVTTVENDHLLLIDDGVASCNAITFKNFLETAKDKTFKGEGLDYFKEIIKSTIAEELAADTSFVEKIYTKTLDKLIENGSDKLSSLFSKIKSRLTDSISSSTLSRSDNLLIMSSSSIEKTPVPKQLLGVPSNFDATLNAPAGTTLYPSDYKNQRFQVDLDQSRSATLIFYKYDDDNPIYLDIELDIDQFDREGRFLYLRYSDESDSQYSRNLVFESETLTGVIPLYKGWYIQKRIYQNHSPVPVLMKL
ncbi:DUF685 domain-containing protein (plasmid) [Borreliella yangtzensis]|uniref:Uncharacterized protein n=1 Tax=Borreliella yangtzensis TaxID=683292 RepID=A0ABR6PBT0_9SPIR|nr:hypothetical protein [Borreliella yangtzensis]